MESSPTDLETTSPSLLGLPLEVCTEILTLLDARSVLSCSETCKQLHGLTASSVPLQYKLALSANGMIDGPSSIGLTPSERLSLLHERRSSWRTLALGPPDASIHLPRQHGGSEFAGGYLGVCPEDVVNGQPDLTLVTLPSRSPPVQAKVETYHFGFRVRDLALDPSQDLLVVLEVPGTDGGFRIHPRAVGNPGDTHSGTDTTVMESKTKVDISECACQVQISDDVVALFVRSETATVVIFNWRTGQELVNMEDAHVVPPDDFTFLSPRAFFITYAHPDAIRMFSFTSPSASRILPITATMRLPPPASGASFVQLLSITSPWLAHSSYSAHFPSNDHRIHTFQLAIENTEEQQQELCIIVRARTLYAILCVAQYRIASGEPPERLVWDWTSWLPPCARVLALNLPSALFRYVHGARMLTRNGEGLMLFDFDVPVKERGNDIWTSGNMGSDESKFRYFGGEPSAMFVRGLLDVSALTEVYEIIRVGARARAGDNDGDENIVDEVDTPDNEKRAPLEDLISALQYGCVCVPEPKSSEGEYWSFLLDEQRIVAVRSVDDGEVLDVWML